MAHVFYDYRGLVQLRLATTEDLAHIHDLDFARWSATSVPVEQLFVDKQLLAFLDGDHDGRIRVYDVLDAHKWAVAHLKNVERLVDNSDTVRLSDLSDAADKLRHLITTRLGSKTGEVTLAEIRAFKESYKKKHPNGDGVVAPAQINDESVRALAAAVVAFGDAPVDVGGEAGVNTASLDKFVAHAQEIVAWESERAWAEALDAAVDEVTALVDEIDRYFLLCDLVAQERAASERLEATAEALRALDVAKVSDVRAYLERVPLQRPTQAGILDVGAHLNPVYADRVRALFENALPLFLGQAGKPITRLTSTQWSKAKDAMKPIAEHKKKKPRDLGFAVDVVLAGASVDQLRTLLDDDQRASAELVGLDDLERLALYQKWLLPLCNNMVSFPALFRLGERCLFEAGTLVLDGRNLTFCVVVVDKATHRPVAERSNIFTVYVELARKEIDGTVKKQLVAGAVTSGTRRGIAVGKRGVFYDRDGKEHDAVVVDVIERPISLLEAAIAPFVRLGQFVNDRIEKLTSSSLAAFEKRATSAADATVTTAAAPVTAAPTTLAVPVPTPAPVTPAPVPPAPRALVPAPAPAAPPAPAAQSGLSSVVVGAGLAVAALGSAAAFVVQTLANVVPLHLLGGVIAVAVAIMALSAFLGWLKLRRRDLSTMLEACGWAFNVRIYLTRRHSLRFTSVPRLPRGSVRKRIVLPVVEDDDSGMLAVLLFLIIGALIVAGVALWQPLLQILHVGS